MKEQFYLHQSCFQEELDNAKISEYQTIIKKFDAIFKKDYKEINDLIKSIQKYINSV